MSSPKEMYQPGDKLKLLFSGKNVEIVKYLPDTSGHEIYEIKVEDSGLTMCCDLDDMAPESNELYRRVQQYKNEMIEKGYRCLAMGRDKDGHWRGFFFQHNDQYQTVVNKNKDVKFKYYWAIPEDEKA